MTKQAMIDATRFLVRELTTDVGGLLTDATNLTGYLEDGLEQTVMDLMKYIPEQFLMTEDINLVAGTDHYTITAEYWMVYKVELHITGDTRREIQIVDPLQFVYHGTTGDTELYPTTCYFMGDTIYFDFTPASSITGAVRLYLVRPEAATLPDLGPTYLPRPAHRLVVYHAASLIAIMIGADPSKFDALYARRFTSFIKLWTQRFYQQPRFVRGSISDRILRDARDDAFYDKSGFFGD